MAAEAERMLYEASRTGDLAAFKQLLHEDPHLLERVSFASSNKTPLHIATMHGNLGIIEQALNINPHLALDLDSKNSSSLHIAAAEGSLEIVTKLLSAAPEVRWWRDGHDMNPVHIAAMKGHVEVLNELLRLDFFPAMERVHRGQTVMHLCVKHGQLAALEALAEKLGELVRAVDDDGETVLHLAIRCKQLETVRYLVESKKIEKETHNSMGKTAVDILNETPLLRNTYDEMKRILRRLVSQSLFLSNIPKLMDMIMVMMVLIATMAFQAAVSPPGGVWQDSTTTTNNTTTAATSAQRPGEAVMKTTHPTLYSTFVGSNISAFASAFVTIILIVTGLPSLNYFFRLMVMYAIGMSIGSIVTSYWISVVVTSPSYRETLINTLSSLGTYVLLFFLILLFSKGTKSQRQAPDLAPDP